MELEKKKHNIIVYPENCAQCLSCMLICSFTHAKSFNPSKAQIQVIPGYFEGKNWIPIKIKFLEDCQETCWLCSQYCAYGALEHVEGNK